MRTKDAIIKELRYLIKEINVNEIADHLNDESLFNWCGAIREELNERIDELWSKL